MISMPEYNREELPAVTVAMPREVSLANIQQWEFKASELQQAEELFVTLKELLHGDPGVGPIIFNPYHGPQKLPRIQILWRSEQSKARHTLYNALAESGLDWRDAIEKAADMMIKNGGSLNASFSCDEAGRVHVDFPELQARATVKPQLVGA